MATIRTAIQITDGLSPAIRAMNRSLNMVISSFEQLNHEANHPIDVASLRAARQELNQAEIAFNSMEQDVRRAAQQQENFNRQVRTGEGAARSMGNAIRSAFIAIGGTMAIKALGEQTDAYANSQARLGLIADKQHTVAQLNDEIMASANRARAKYSDMVDIVGKLGVSAGAAFSNNDEMVRFSELLTKNFRIAGASAQEQSAAMYQLTQAMASGRLQGDEYRSIIENAPLLAQAIANQMGLTMGELKKVSSQGIITSDIIKAAMFNSADEIEARFKKMPITFAGVANLIGNKVNEKMQPTYAALSEWVNSAQGADAINSVSSGIITLANGLSSLLTKAMAVYNFFATNWQAIEPMVLLVAGAFTALKLATIGYNVVLGVTAGLERLAAARAAIRSGVTLMDAAATTTATGAQVGFNAALLACPLTWIVLAIAAVIAIFYALVGVFNIVSHKSVSATGLIAGSFMWLLAVLGNIFISLLQVLFIVIDLIVNAVIGVANFLGNVFVDPIGAIIHLFGAMADGILQTLQSLAKMIDTIFGTSLSSKVAGWRNTVSSLADELAAKYGNGKYQVKMEAFSAQDQLAKKGVNIGRLNYGDAFGMGYDWGKKLKVPGLKDGDILGSKLDDLNANMTGIGSDVSGIKDSAKLSEDDLKYLRDIAERDVINRFTTAEVKVNMSNSFGDIHQTADLDGVLAHIENSVNDTLAVVAEGANR